MIKKTAWWLMFIGALNWGLVGVGAFFGSSWNLVNIIFGGVPTLEFIIYILVGVSALYSLSSCKNCTGCSCCKDGSCGKK